MSPFTGETPGRQVELDLDFMLVRVAMDDPLNAADKLIEIDLGDARRVVLEHVAHPTNDFAGALGYPVDVEERLTNFLQVGLGCVEQLYSDGGVEEDRGEWLL